MDVVSKILVFGARYLTEIATQTVISSYRRSSFDKINPALNKRKDDIRDAENQAHNQGRGRGTYNVIDEQFRNIEKEIKNGAITSRPDTGIIVKKLDQGKLERILQSKRDEEHRKIAQERLGTHFKQKDSDQKLETAQANIENCSKDGNKIDDKNQLIKLNSTLEDHEMYTMEMIVKLTKGTNVPKQSEENTRHLIIESNENAPVDTKNANFRENTLLKDFPSQIEKIDEQKESINKSETQPKLRTYTKLEEDQRLNQTEDVYYTTDNINQSKSTLEAQSCRTQHEHKGHINTRENTSQFGNLDTNQNISEVTPDYNVDLVVRIKRKIEDSGNQPEASKGTWITKPGNKNVEQIYPSFLCDQTKPRKKSEQPSLSASNPINTSKFTIITPLEKVGTTDKSKQYEKDSVPLDPSKYTVITSLPNVINEDKNQKSDEIWQSHSEHGNFKKTLENEEQWKTHPTILPNTTPASSKIINLTRSDTVTMVKKLSKRFKEDTQLIREDSPKDKDNIPQLVKHIEEINGRNSKQYFEEKNQSMPDLLENYTTIIPACEKLHSKNSTADLQFFPQNRIDHVKSIFQHPIHIFPNEKGSVNVKLDAKLIEQKIFELRSKKLEKCKETMSNRPIWQSSQQIKEKESTIKSQDLQNRIVYYLDEVLSNPSIKRNENIETKSIQDSKSYFQKAKRLDETSNNNNDILFRFKSDLFKKYSSREFDEAQFADLLAKMDSQISCMMKNLEQFNLFERKLSDNNFKKASNFNKEDTPRILKNTEEFKQFETNLFVGKMKSIIANIRKKRPGLPLSTNRMATFEEFENKVLTEKFMEIMDKTKEEPINILNNFDATKVKELLYEEYLNEKLRYINQDGCSLQKTEKEFKSQQKPFFNVKNNNYDKIGNRKKRILKESTNNKSSISKQSEGTSKQDSNRLMKDLEAFYEFENTLSNSKDVDSSLKGEDGKLDQCVLLSLKNQEHFKKIANKILNSNNYKTDAATKSKIGKSSKEETQSSRKERLPIKYKGIKTKDHNLKSEKQISKDALEELKDVLNDKKKTKSIHPQLETNLSPGLKLFNISKSHKSAQEDSSDSKINNIEKDISSLLTNKEIFKQAKNRPLSNKLEILNNIKQESKHTDNVEDAVKKPNETDKAKQPAKNKLSYEADRKIDLYKKQELQHKLDALDKPETSLNKEETNIVESKLNQLKDMYYKRQKQTEHNFNSVPKTVKPNAQTSDSKSRQVTNIETKHSETITRKFKEILSHNKLSSKQSLDDFDDKSKSEKATNRNLDLKPTLQQNKTNLQNEESENILKSNKVEEIESAKKERTTRQFATPAGKFVGNRKDESKQFSNIIDVLNTSGLIKIKDKVDKPKNQDSAINQKEQVFESKEIKESKVDQALNNVNKKYNKSRIPLNKQNLGQKNLKNDFRGIENYDQKNIGKVEDNRVVASSNFKETVKRKPSDEFSKIERTFTKVQLDSNSEYIDVDVTARSKNNENKCATSGDSINENCKIYKHELSKNRKRSASDNLENLLISQIESNVDYESNKLNKETQRNENIAFANKLKEIENIRREDSKQLLNNCDYFKKSEKTLSEKVNSNMERDAEENLTIFNNMQQQIIDKLLNQTIQDLMKQVRLDGGKIRKDYETFKSVEENISKAAVATKIKEIEIIRKDESKQLLNNIDCFKNFEELLCKKLFNAEFECIKQDASCLQVNLKHFCNIEKNIADNCFKETIKNLTEQVIIDTKKMQFNYNIFENFEEKLTNALAANQLNEFESKRIKESKMLLNNFDSYNKFEKLLNEKVYKSKYAIIDQNALLEKNYETFYNVEADLKQKELIEGFERIIHDSASTYKNDIAFRKLENNIRERSFLKTITKKRLELLSETIRNHRGNVEQYLLKKVSAKPEFKSYELFWHKIKAIDVDNFCRGISQAFHKNKKQARLEKGHVENSCNTKIMAHDLIPNLEDRIKMTEEDVREKSKLINVNNSVFESTEKITNMVKIITPKIQKEDTDKRKENFNTGRIQNKDIEDAKIQKEKVDLLGSNKSSFENNRNILKHNKKALLTERLHTDSITDTDPLLNSKSSLELNRQMLINNVPFGATRPINKLEQHYFINNVYVKSNFLTANKFAFKRTDSQFKQTARSEQIKNIPKNLEHNKVYFIHNTDKSIIRRQMSKNPERLKQRLIHMHNIIMDIPDPKRKSFLFEKKSLRKEQRCTINQGENVALTNKSAMKQKEMTFDQKKFVKSPKESIKVVTHSEFKDIPDLKESPKKSIQVLTHSELTDIPDVKESPKESIKVLTHSELSDIPDLKESPKESIKFLTHSELTDIPDLSPKESIKLLTHSELSDIPYLKESPKESIIVINHSELTDLRDLKESPKESIKVLTHSKLTDLPDLKESPKESIKLQSNLELTDIPDLTSSPREKQILFEKMPLKVHIHSGIGYIPHPTSKEEQICFEERVLHEANNSTIELDINVQTKQQDTKLSEEVDSIISKNEIEGTTNNQYENSRTIVKSNTGNKEFINQPKKCNENEDNISTQQNCEDLIKYKDNIGKFISAEFALKNVENEMNKAVIEGQQHLLFNEEADISKYITQNHEAGNNTSIKLDTSNGCKNIPKENTTTENVKITEQNQGFEANNIKQMIHRTTNILEDEDGEIADKENHKQKESFYKNIFSEKDKLFMTEYKHEIDIISEFANDFDTSAQRNKASKNQQNKPLEPRVSVNLPFGFSKVIGAKSIKTAEPKNERSSKSYKTVPGSRKDSNTSTRKTLQISNQNPLKIKMMKIQPVKEDKALRTEKKNTNNLTKNVNSKSIVPNLVELGSPEHKMEGTNKDNLESKHIEEIPKVLEDVEEYIIHNSDKSESRKDSNTSTCKTLQISNQNPLKIKMVKIQPVKEDKALRTEKKNTNNLTKNVNSKSIVPNLVELASPEHKMEGTDNLESKHIEEIPKVLEDVEEYIIHNSDKSVMKEEDCPKKLINLQPEIMDIPDVKTSPKNIALHKEQRATQDNIAITDKSIMKESEATINQENFNEIPKGLILSRSELTDIPGFTSLPNEEIVEENALPKEHMSTIKEEENVAITDKSIMKLTEVIINEEIFEESGKELMNSELNTYPASSQNEKQIPLEKKLLKVYIHSEIRDIPDPAEGKRNGNSDELSKNKDNIEESIPREFDLNDFENDTNNEQINILSNEVSNDNKYEIFSSKIQEENIGDVENKNIAIKEMTPLSKMWNETTKMFDELLGRTNINKQNEIKQKFTYDEYKYDTDIISESANNFAIEAINKERCERKIKSPTFKCSPKGNRIKTVRATITTRNEEKIDSINGNSSKGSSQTSKLLSKLRPFGHDMRIASMEIPIIVEEGNSFSPDEKTKEAKTSKNIEMKFPIVDDNCIIRNVSKLRPFGHGVNIWKTNGIPYMQPYPDIESSGLMDMLNDHENIKRMNCKRDISTVGTIFSSSDNFSVLKGFIDRQIRKLSKQIPAIKRSKPKTKRKHTKHERKPKSLNFKSQNNKWKINATEDLELALASYKNKNQKENIVIKDLEVAVIKQNKNQQDSEVPTDKNIKSTIEIVTKIASYKNKNQKENIPSKDLEVAVIKQNQNQQDSEVPKDKNIKSTIKIVTKIASYKNKNQKENIPSKDLEVAVIKQNKNQQDSEVSKDKNIKSTIEIVTKSSLIENKPLKIQKKQKQKQNFDALKDVTFATRPLTEKQLRKKFKVSLHGEYYIKQKINQPNEAGFCKLTQAYKHAQVRRDIKNLEDVIARIKKVNLIRKNLSLSLGNSHVMDAIENRNP